VLLFHTSVLYVITTRKYIGISLAIILIISVIIFFLTGNYQGEGQYFAEGIFPFRNYQIIFPEFPITTQGKYEYQFRNSRGDKSFFPKLILTSTQKIPYWELTTPITITLQGKEGNVLLHKEGALNSHYARMWQEGKTSWSLSKEWGGYYLFQDPLISNQAVPFSTQQRPLDTNDMTYRGTNIALESMKWYSIIVTVDAISNPDLADEINGHLEFISSWK